MPPACVSRSWLFVLVALVLVVPSTASAWQARVTRLNEALSPYLSAMTDGRSAIRDQALIARTNQALSRVAEGSSSGCRQVVRRTQREVARRRGNPASKRKRILDAFAPVYDRC